MEFSMNFHWHVICIYFFFVFHCLSFSLPVLSCYTTCVVYISFSPCVYFESRSVNDYFLTFFSCLIRCGLWKTVENHTFVWYWWDYETYIYHVIDIRNIALHVQRSIQLHWTDKIIQHIQKMEWYIFDRIFQMISPFDIIIKQNLTGKSHVKIRAPLLSFINSIFINS